MVGSTFHFLTVIGKAPTRGSRKDRTYWHCRCECGRVVDVRRDHVTSGRIVSCGCQRTARAAKMNAKHGHTKDRSISGTYYSWAAMIQRCTNPRNQSYPNYGGRGIRVCRRWLKFDNFLADMSERPPHATLERTNNNRSYTPSNTRWATPLDQARNKRSTRFVTINGETLCLTDWAHRFGLRPEFVRNRITRRGMTAYVALTTPVRPWKRRTR